MIIPDAAPKGLIGSYSFDEIIPGVLFDASGNGNHGIAGPRASTSFVSVEESLMNTPNAKLNKGYGNEDKIAENNPLFSPTVPTAPGRNTGLAGSFNGRIYYRISPSNSIASINNAFTLSSWLYLADPLISSKADSGCPIFSLHTASISLTPERHLAVNVQEGVTVKSHARIRPNHWTHVTMTYDPAEKQYALYVNGIPDIRAEGAIPTFVNTPLYIGATPNTECKVASFYLDDIKITSDAATPTTIAAQAFSSLGSTESSFVHLSCSRDQPCTFEQARSRCMPGYHMCTHRELASGGYAVCRIQGWLHYEDKLWTADDMIRFKNTYKMKPRVDIKSEKARDEEILNNDANDHGHKDSKDKSIKHEEWDIEEEVLGEHSAKWKREQALKRALAKEQEAMNEHRLAMCCAYDHM